MVEDSDTKLYHYATSESAINGILANGTLRLSPLRHTNDIWESAVFRPGLLNPPPAASDTDADHLARFAELDPLWNRLDDQFRSFSKLACLVEGTSTSTGLMDGSPGWAHIAMWAHYAARHTGVCFEFDRNRLIQAFAEANDIPGRRLAGRVIYVDTSTVLPDLDLRLVPPSTEESQAVALRYMTDNADLLYFQKHKDWENENEFRLLTIDATDSFSFIPIADALTGVIAGQRFPWGRMRELASSTHKFPNATLTRVIFSSRQSIRLEVPDELLPTARQDPADSSIAPLDADHPFRSE
ncbi:DUF2971 domain-containing protein [Nocardioides nematodiphilus]|uniref:DUF2971 domain-containing protein n=1 Tax=Nocardioides nematodiphilus TaxID=2849669 RepID=UPI001CDA1AF6|nr:DUF2971 domain-containing protein [Nocardioides nematodiphilus]MCA1982967.1 DUF2971 domain-containing protein [Nocardioides nematodiphilus]